MNNNLFAKTVLKNLIIDTPVFFLVGILGGKYFLLGFAGTIFSIYYLRIYICRQLYRLKMRHKVARFFAHQTNLAPCGKYWKKLSYSSIIRFGELLKYAKKYGEK